MSMAFTPVDDLSPETLEVETPRDDGHAEGAEADVEGEYEEYEEDYDDEANLFEFAEPPPHSVAARVFIPHGSRRRHKCLVSYNMATEEQKKLVFHRLRRADRDEPLGYGVFAGQPCHELWVDGVLVGLATSHVYGWRSEDDASIRVSLEAIFMKPRFRGRGFTGILIGCMADEAFQQILTCMMQEKAKGIERFEVITEAELLNEGGQVAVQALGEAIEIHCISAAICLGVEVESQTYDDGF